MVVICVPLVEATLSVYAVLVGAVPRTASNKVLKMDSSTNPARAQSIRLCVTPTTAEASAVAGYRLEFRLVPPCLYILFQTAAAKHLLSTEADVLRCTHNTTAFGFLLLA